MKFKVVKDDILPFLQHANNFTSPKNLNTVLQNILIDAEAERIVFRATNMQVGFSGFLETDADATGTVTISGKKLLDIIKELPDGAVIEFYFDGSKLNINSGKSSFKLSVLGPALFPTMSEIVPEYYIKIKSDLLADLLKKTSFAISTDASKIEYTGAHFNVYGNRLEISAADFQRIATAQATFEEEFADEFIINIPKKTITELIKILDDEEYVEVETDRKQVLFKVGNMTIYSKLIEKYIKSITKLFTNEYPISARLNRKEFIDVVRRISTITSEITHGVLLSFEDNHCTVYSLETEYGQGFEVIESVEYSGENIDIIFNAKHIIEIINNMDTEHFSFRMMGRRNPALILPDDNTFKYLVVPISIDKF